MTETEPQAKTPVLEFREAVMPGRPGEYLALNSTTFTIQSGDLAIIRLQRGQEQLPLASAAQGLILPSSGDVRFEQKSWATMDYEQQLKMRSRIGRVFDHSGWVSNLSVLENVLLAGQHHATSSDQALLEKAHAWALRFGIDELPSTRRTFPTPWKQRVVQWVRAFLNDPKLLLLERPGADVPHPQREKLLAAVLELLQRNGSVMWLTDDDGLWQSALPPCTSRFQVHDATIVPVGGGLL